MQLSDWERQLEECARREQPLDLSNEGGPTKPVLRGEALTEIAHRLVRDGAARRGLNLVGATVTGVVNFEHFDFGRPLHLENCVLESAPVFEQCRMTWLSLRDSRVPGVHAYRLTVAHDVVLNGTFASTETISLQSADIGGTAILAGPTDDGALWTTNLNGSTIGKDVLLEPSRDETIGAPGRCDVDLEMAHVGGNLAVWGAFAGLFLDGASLAGSVHMFGARIGRHGPSDTVAISARGCRLDGSLLMSAAVSKDGAVTQTTVVGGIDLSDFHVSGTVTAEGVDIDAGDGNSYSWLAAGLTVDGAFSLAPWSGPESYDYADGAEELFVPSVLRGAINLTDSTFGKSLTIAGTTITATKGFAVLLTGADVRSDLTIGFTDDDGLAGSPDVTLVGGLSLESARVGGAVAVTNCSVRAGVQDESPELQPSPFINLQSLALSAQLLRADRGIRWTPADSVGAIDLSFVHTQLYQDSPDSWPGKDRLNLEGMVYSKLTGAEEDLSPKQRITWLRQQEHPAPDSYDALRDFYLHLGDRSGAAAVSIAKNVDVASRRGALWGCIAQAYRVIAGCGYKPIRSLLWLGALWLSTALLLTSVAPQIMVATDGESSARVTACTSSYPCFNAFGYSIETVVPLASGEQVESWRIDGSIEVGSRLRIYLAIASALGLIFSTTAVGAMTGFLRRE